MSLLPPPPTPGQVVRVRQRQYLVDEVVPPPEPVDATLVRLSCVDDDAQGEPLEVLWEKELDPEVLTGADWARIAERGFDPPHLFAAYFHTLRWNCVTATDPKLFQSPFRAGIRIDSYQLEPLRKALLLPRVNLFIADDVGLGKTIEAGLIARELLLRRKAREIVVAAPPSMLLQWQEELETRFGLTFEILDKAYVARVRQERGWGVNPWTTHPRFLVSHRLLIDEDYAAPLRDWLGDLRPGTLLILDEAHHAAPASGAKYAIDSKFTRAVRDLAGRFEHRLFLSATPHNGHSNSFSALLEILDSQRFCRGVPVKGKKLLDDVMVRRLKEDLREVAGGLPRRDVVQEDISGLPEDAPELALSRLLDKYRQLREKRLKGLTKHKQAQAAILISGLQQRLLSSVEAFARTLRVHRRTVLRHWEEAQKSKEPPAEEKPTWAQLDLIQEGVGSDDERATLPEEELATEEDAQFEAATTATAGPLGEGTARDLFAREQEVLDEMTRVAEAARGEPDAKVRKLVDWLRDHMCSGLPPLGQAPPRGDPSRWSDCRLIIFTEYDDTKRYLREQLLAAIAGTDRADERIAVFHGPTPPAEREELKRAFNANPAKHPLRILIATDAAREGLNLQSHCSDLFHFDLPWNPGRIEQRNGRIDRKLQPQPVVRCHYFVYLERPEDRVLQVLVRKIGRIKKELGSLAPVVEARLAEALRGGIRHDRVEEQVRQIEEAEADPDRRRVVEEELEEARERQDDLRAEIDSLRTRLEEARDWIAFKEDHFRAALSSALDLLGAEELKSLDGTAGEAPARWRFPTLDQRAGADPSWAALMDVLRPPRQKDEKPWEWRRNAPVRPVVFEDPGVLQDEVVHLHLEHRVVQRLLGRFRAQGFVHHDLSRACLAHTQDAIPRVILLGRLSLYGPRASRLHEQLVAVTARWAEPGQRKGPLKHYGKEAEAKTLDLLEEALLPRGGRGVAKEIMERLRAGATRDLQDLLPELQDRGQALSLTARKALAERGKREAEAMRDLLAKQRDRIAATRDAANKPPKDLTREFEFMKDLDVDERRQLDSNRRHWEKRLATIGTELDTEPARIQEFYQVRAERLEPVGLVYLWPVTG